MQIPSKEYIFKKLKTRIASDLLDIRAFTLNSKGSTGTAHSSAGVWRVNPSVNASSFTQMWLWYPTPHHFYLGLSLQKSLSAQIPSHLEYVLYPWSVLQGGCSWSFRMSQGTISAAIPPRTTGNTELSCYRNTTSVSTLTFELERRYGFSGSFLEIASVYLQTNILMWIERSTCAGHLWAARCAGSLCDFVCPKSVSREPQAWSVGTHWAQQPRHITSPHTGTFFSWEAELELLQVFHVWLVEASCSAIEFLSDMPMEACCDCLQMTGLLLS